jgi:hypothetical protein
LKFGDADILRTRSQTVIDLHELGSAEPVNELRGGLQKGFKV